MAFVFQIVVKKDLLQPNPNVRVRILDSTNKDVTAAMFGAPNQYTNSFGVLRKVFQDAPLPKGAYKIQLSGTGYSAEELNSSNNASLGDWNGVGEFQWIMSAASANNYTIVAPNSKYVSPLMPVVFYVTNNDGAINELIQAIVTHSDGRKSVIGCIPDANGLAVIDIRNRIRLRIDPVLVPDNYTSYPDNNFSNEITVDFVTSVDGNEPIAITNNDNSALSFLLLAANIYPEEVNDLKEFAEPVSKWITPFDNSAQAFRGHYSDAMVWLPDVPGNLTLKIEYKDSSGSVATSETKQIPSSNFVQRIKIKTTVASNITQATMQIFKGSTVRSDILTINYVG